MNKAKVLRHHYSEENDSVFWEVQVVGEETSKTLVWERKDFGPSFNINHDIPAKLVKEFGDKMVGKTINVDIGAAGPAPQMIAKKVAELSILKEAAIEKGNSEKANALQKEIESLEK